MTISKPLINTFLLIGLVFLVLCPPTFAQINFNDPEDMETLPQSQWRQRVLHNSTRIARESSRDADYQEYQPSQHTSQQKVYRSAQREPSYSRRRSEDASKSPTANSQHKHTRLAQRGIIPEPAGAPGDMKFEPIATEGPLASLDDCCDSCSSCGDDCDCGYSMECCPWMFRGPRNLAIFGGVHGYKGPRDRGSNGNFGFQEGVNFGAPLGDPWGCGYQLGFAALQSNISGYQQNYPDPTLPVYNTVTSDRHQYFFTAGVFRRADHAGWQWGVVFDLLHDTYYEASDLKQIRTETGYLFNECFELGYSGAYGIGGDRVRSSTVTTDSFDIPEVQARISEITNRNIDGQLDPTDQFVVYFRRYFCNGGDGRIFGGLTGNGDGLFGGDVWVPLGGSWAIQNSFNYLIPKQGRGSSLVVNGTDHLEGAQIRESWNVAINLVWYPGRSASCLGKSCYRPLLNVADNSQFMVRESTEITNTTTQQLETVPPVE
ncbi:MAG: DUF6666 family protein [Thermoguttaceae bacterium]